MKVRRLSDGTVALLCDEQELAAMSEALNDCLYWESDERYRDDGFAKEPYSDDVNAAERLGAVALLVADIDAAYEGPTHAPDCDLGEDCTCGAEEPEHEEEASHA